MSKSIFHSVEKFVQEQSGERNIALRNGGMISNQLSASAVTFLHSQSFFYVSSLDRDGMLWSSVLVGKPGFLQFDENQQLYLDPASHLPT
ncbi:putative pyridoxine 5'-phosphate oxidase superfamily flavin-nucleotide-binding protein [Mucilaginibacter sp. UYP25]|uniref:hypothetical protein n=1 Tax=unclassified Mucilaginibacter TaxID=2617802 RepID=UPI003396DB90